MAESPKSLADVTEIVKVSSTSSSFRNLVNSRLRAGWILVHVGQETIGEPENPRQTTVAILGKVR